ncbi:hypothetical protein NHQ30_001583 [Ciborinia camelliae]|nr:hypothetical protein NHQ30_001583 [Ciborinia camelliae]
MASSPNLSLHISSLGKRMRPVPPSHRSSKVIRGDGDSVVEREIIDLTIDDSESDEEEGSRVQKSVAKSSNNVSNHVSEGDRREGSISSTNGTIPLAITTKPAKKVHGNTLLDKKSTDSCISGLWILSSHGSTPRNPRPSIDSSSDSEVDIFAGTSLYPKHQSQRSRLDKEDLLDEASSSSHLTIYPATTEINKVIVQSATESPGYSLNNCHESSSDISEQISSVAPLAGKSPSSAGAECNPTSSPNPSTTTKRLKPNALITPRKEDEHFPGRRLLKRPSRNWREERILTGTLRCPRKPRPLVPKKPLVQCKRSARRKTLGGNSEVGRRNVNIWNDFTRGPVDRLRAKQRLKLGEADNDRDDPQTVSLKAESLKRVDIREKKSLNLGEVLDMEEKSKELVEEFANTVNSMLENKEKDQTPDPDLRNDGKDEEAFFVPADVLKRLERSDRMKSVPNFLTPHKDIFYIEIDGQTFAVYADFLRYHVPLLHQYCSAATEPHKAVTPEILQGFGYKVIALFIQWMYSSPADAYSGLSDEEGETACQDFLIKLWVLGKRLEIRGLEIDALDALGRRIKLDQYLDLGTSRWLWNNTNKDDKLREYFIQSCVEDYSALESRINEFAPDEMKEIIKGKISWLRDWTRI